MSYPYFRFFPGDYLRDTSDLSLIQHGAYLKFLLHYYASGKPLPDNLDQLCRIVGARTRHDRAAVEYVRTRFFTSKDGLRIQNRVAKELKHMASRSEHATDSARKRWSERNALAHANAMRTQCYPDLEPDLDQTHVVVTPTVGTGPPVQHDGKRGNGQNSTSPQWWLSAPGTDAKGRELGLPARPGEEYPEYRQRLFAAIRSITQGSKP